MCFFLFMQEARKDLLPNISRIFQKKNPSKPARVVQKPTVTKTKNTNYAFIDAQNLHQSAKHWGWKLDYLKLREYLRENYGIDVAYLFIGYRPENAEIYSNLQKLGYIIVFKETAESEGAIVKGNCDIELVLQAMIEYQKYDKALIITGDGDFSSFIRYLNQQNKLEMLLVPNRNAYSSFLKKSAKEKIGYLNLLKENLSYEPPKKTKTGDSEKNDVSIYVY
jgi:uncharacterized LabA/DUF88 family protein